MDRTLPYKFNANMSTIDCRSVAKHAEPRNSVHPADQACCCMEIFNCLAPHLLASVRGVYLLPGCMELCIHRDTSPEENSGLSYLPYLRSGGGILRGIRCQGDPSSGKLNFHLHLEGSGPCGVISQGVPANVISGCLLGARCAVSILNRFVRALGIC